MPNWAERRGKMKGRRMTGDAEISAWMVVAAAVLAAAVVLFAIFKPPVFGAEVVEPKVITGSFIVSGYPDGQFAIKGEPEKKLNEEVAKVKAQIKSLLGELQLQFIVVGSADTTGTGNDDLAGKRADQVKAVLSANFPEAKIVSWSRGDADNVKQVRVDYKITSKPAIAQAAPVSAPEKPAKKFDSFDWLLTIGAFIVVIIGGLLAIVKVRANREARIKSETKKSGSEAKWLDLVMANKKRFSVIVTYDYEHGEIISPYKSRTGLKIKAPIVVPKKIKDSLKGCLKKEEFASQTEELIRKGVIKKVADTDKTD